MRIQSSFSTKIVGTLAAMAFAAVLFESKIVFGQSESLAKEAAENGSFPVEYRLASLDAKRALSPGDASIKGYRQGHDRHGIIIGSNILHLGP